MSIRLSGIGTLIVLLSLMAFHNFAAGAQETETVKTPLHWLEQDAPALSPGVTWTVPWPKGEYQPDQSFALKDKDGEAIAMQSWPFAYWPDGSLKWSAHAVADSKVSSGSYDLFPGEAPVPDTTLNVEETDDAVIVDSGVAVYRIPKSGTSMIESITRNDVVIAKNARLIGSKQNKPEIKPGESIQRESFIGQIEKVIVEQAGPLRAVVKIDGKHVSEQSPEGWLPFSVRLYFYAGNEAMRIMHTFVFDGDEEVDFISGLGVRFDVPMRDELYNRHVRFVSEDKGVFKEAIRGITGLRRDPGYAARQAQVAGKATPPIDTWDRRVSDRMHLIPAWNDYELTQLNADGYQIRKRTKEGHTWVRSTGGTRATGLAYFGGVTGGVAFGQRYFWQRHPVQIDIRNAASETAEATMWLWSPEAPAMDLRFYHDGMGMETYEQEIEGLNITYEDYEKGWGDPHGVARTNELYLWALAATPSHEELLDISAAVQTPPLLVCEPQHYLDAGVFGALWTLPDRSTPLKADIENLLDFIFDVYAEQIEEERWYGFWDHGDVMHTYDEDRQCWRYDVGGYAWDNSELSPDLWLWYYFLRTGRSDVYRIAEAMTRHTGEVDVYHLGRFKGLGSRHNVQHWGDSSKQPRISTAANRRFLLYLTADERIRDQITELLDSDQRLRTVNIGRKVTPVKEGDPPYPFPAYMGFGNMYCSIAAAWLTEWELTQDTKWRDRLLTGLRGIGKMQYGWASGGCGYDPDTGEFLENPHWVGGSHLSAVFGAVEINAELVELLDIPDYEKTWVKYCEFYNAGRAAQEQEFGGRIGGALRDAHSRCTAYAAMKLDRPDLAQRAWAEFLESFRYSGELKSFHLEKDPFNQSVFNNKPGEIGISTNACAEWGLAAIQNLKLAGDPTNRRANWLIRDDAIVQNSLLTDIKLGFGDHDWTDIDYTLQARKISGNEGFLIVFGMSDDDNYLWINLGGWRNTLHRLQYAQNGRRQAFGESVSGSIETGRWYDIHVRYDAGHIQVWLDGELILDETMEGYLQIHGQVGIGTWETAAEFRNIKVKSLDGDILFEGLPEIPSGAN